MPRGLCPGLFILVNVVNLSWYNGIPERGLDNILGKVRK